MLRRRFLKSAALSPLAFTAFPSSLGASGFEAAGKDVSRTISGTAGSDSPMMERFELTLNRVLAGDQPAYREDFVLEDVRPRPGRRFTEYSGDVSGRYIGALATASRVYGMQFPDLDRLVAKTIALQKPDGYFGSEFHYDKPADLDLALLWGNGRLLVGLLEYYRLDRKPEVLAACVRLGDWLVRIGPLMLSERIRGEFGAQHFASSYICWTQQTEGLASLFEVTKDVRFRDLALSIAAATERRPSDHVHGYLTSVRGWVQLAAGNEELLRKAEAAWEDVASSKDLLITGGVPEGWSPNGHRTEGCGEADWLRLSLALWKATGKAKYLEMAERTTFNEFAFNQYAGGDFGHRVYTETGLPAGGAVRAWWCCTLHGLRAFPDIQSSVFRREQDGLAFDLPVDGRIESKTGSSEMCATAFSSLARDGRVRIRIDSTGTESQVLRVRKPGWATNVTIRVNGKAADMPVDAGYLPLERKWRAGDEVTVQYEVVLRKEPAGGDRFAYWVGPWLLGAPASENQAYFNEMTTDNRVGEIQSAQEGPSDPVMTGSGMTGSGVAGGFRVPIAARVAAYVPAEFPEQPGRASLRAIAEQTGQATTSWELRFLGSQRA